MATPQNTTAQPTPPKPSHRVRNVVIVVVVIAVVVIVALALIPIPHSFTEQLNSSFLTDGKATFSPTSGSAVTGTWSTASGDSVTLSITDSNGGTVYTASAHSGSFSFTANTPPYTFTDSSTLSETVHISGTYSTPLL
jgi:hypothetical protein